MTEQQGDVRLFQTLNDGEISVVEGVTEMTPGLENAVYLSLFGGNAMDSGSDNNPLEYWGNYLTDEPAEKYRSETQYLLISLPAVSANIKPMRDAILRDLDWMITSGAASTLAADVELTGVNRVRITITVNGESSSDLVFEENWLASL